MASADVSAAFFAALPDGAIVVDAAGQIVLANPAAAALLGCHPDALIGTAIGSWYHDPDEARDRHHIDRLGLDGRPTPRDWRTADGGRRVLLVTARALGDAVGLVLRPPGDLDELVERATRTADTFRTVIEHLPDCVIIHARGRILYANATMLATWRGARHELIGRSAFDLVHPDDHELVRERMTTLADGRAVLPFIDERLVRSDGTVFLAQVGAVSISFDGQPAVMVVARDVTEARERQARGGQIDRMVALGTLAAGVAHEIGNPLTYLLLRLDAATVRGGELRSALPSGTPAAPVLDELLTHLAAVADGARRVRTIVGELRTFSRSDDLPAVIEVAGPVERALKLAGHALNGIDVLRRFTAARPVLIADGKLTQVALNLLVNASHAIRQAGPGPHTITVRIWTERDRTLLEIADTGIGIAPADLGRVFDPFFSTKPVGEGLGLGLATAQSIVTSASGTIAVDSVPGAGATFTVSLPAAPG